MSTFDLSTAANSMAPQLSNTERLEYVQKQREFIEDLLEDAEDSKWVYQALVECAVIESKLTGSLSHDVKQNIRKWLEKLKDLDPLRSGRWTDLSLQLLGDDST